MNWQRVVGKLLASSFIVKGKVQPSFSQAGEDQVIRYLVNDCLLLSKPTYLDVGTHHPVFGNNTYYFYGRGSRGVCVEPDPRYEQLIRKYRKKDKLITAGVATSGSGEQPFYLFPKGYGGWNTFSKEEATKRREETGIGFEIISKQIISINDIIRENFDPWPNIISIDVEGLDLAILQSLDFEKYKPEIVCVESITFSYSNEQEKISEIAAFMQTKGYFVFGDTYVNTIFCRRDAFKTIKR